jgi:tight adherence protein B
VSAPALAAAAAALAAAGLVDVLGGVSAHAGAAAPRLAGPARSALDAFVRAGSEGRDPAAAERRRLLALGALAAFGAAGFVFGMSAGLLAAALAPAAAGRLLRARRARYRRGVDAGAAGIATALADALSGGHSLRGAVTAAAESLEGAPGHELARAAASLELGATTDDALDAMRRRAASPRIDVVVAGALMQKKAGGDLAGLLRGCARAFEDEARLLGEVKAATAQARFTGLVVVLLPAGGAGLAELASPGFLGRLAAFPLSAWFLGMALAMQVGAAFAIRRLARSRE